MQRNIVDFDDDLTQQINNVNDFSLLEDSKQTYSENL